MRSHRRRLPIEHTLIAGDVTELSGIMTALAWLAPDAYGQVLIEVGVDEWLPVLAVPPRVTVYRIERSPQGRGVAVSRAAAAWVEEWIPGDPDERRAVCIWAGEHVDLSCPAISGLAERL